MSALLEVLRARGREVGHPLPGPMTGIVAVPLGLCPRFRICKTPYPEPICSCGAYVIEWTR